MDEREQNGCHWRHIRLGTCPVPSPVIVERFGFNCNCNTDTDTDTDVTLVRQGKARRGGVNLTIWGDQQWIMQCDEMKAHKRAICSKDNSYSNSDSVYQGRGYCEIGRRRKRECRIRRYWSKRGWMKGRRIHRMEAFPSRQGKRKKEERGMQNDILQLEEASGDKDE